MKKILPLVLALCAAIALPMRANAQSPAQGPAGELVSLRVLDGGTTATGTHLAALELTLAQGWKTYWRAPGDAGIPPQFDWRGSRNVGAVRIIWPAPIVFDQNGMRSIGYQNRLVLPVEITPTRPGQPLRLAGRMDLGMCREVCIPGTVHFDNALDPQAARNPAIAAALAQRPYRADEAGVQQATCSLGPTADGLRLTARITMPAAGGHEVAVIEPGDPAIWVSQPETTRKGGILTATADLVHANGSAFALNRSGIRITVLGEARAVDIIGCTSGS